MVGGWSYIGANLRDIVKLQHTDERLKYSPICRLYKLLCAQFVETTANVKSKPLIYSQNLIQH